MRFSLALGVAAGMVGCAVDTDGDGLTNREEKKLGLDLEQVDTDGDGLSDGQEVNETFTNALDPDTDGDGYTDFDELTEGSDPRDADDGIYEGGWPYYADKDAIPGQNRETWQVGRRIRRFSKMVDQFGDDVDLHDFYNQDIPIIVDVSATWCPPCLGMASWLEGETFAPMEPYGELRDAVDEGRIHWVTVVGEATDGSNAVPGLAAEWSEEFPNPRILVLADEEREHQQFVELGGWPTITVLTPDLELVHRTQGDYTTFATPALDLLDDLEQ